MTSTSPEAIAEINALWERQRRSYNIIVVLYYIVLTVESFFVTFFVAGLLSRVDDYVAMICTACVMLVCGFIVYCLFVKFLQVNLYVYNTKLTRLAAKHGIKIIHI